MRTALWRLVSPVHVLEWWRRGRATSSDPTSRARLSSKGLEKNAYKNLQLQLYADILDGGFLHYGYFDDPNVDPRTLGLADLNQAQTRYAEIVLGEVTDRSAPVLDVGSGMGGMSRILLERGFTPVALTPDRAQVEFIRNTLPEIEILEGRFHEIGYEGRWGTFGTILTAESFQYLFLDNALAFIERLLKPGGSWVLCDYFRAGPEVSGSGHVWSDFVDAAHQRGWSFELQRDITLNVAPSMAFVHLLGQRIGLPAFQYLCGRLRHKHPRLHYILEPSLEQSEAVLEHHVEQSSVRTFTNNRKYMLAVLRHDPPDSERSALSAFSV